jgi:hypothetical protein
MAREELPTHLQCKLLCIMASGRELCKVSLLSLPTACDSAQPCVNTAVAPALGVKGNRMKLRYDDACRTQHKKFMHSLKPGAK